MGIHLIDQYFLLHFAVGVVVYFWAMPFWVWMAIHTAFELTENTIPGMALINSFPLWPGGKPQADSTRNIVGDSLAAALGWWAAQSLDVYMGSAYK